MSHTQSSDERVSLVLELVGSSLRVAVYAVTAGRESEVYIPLSSQTELSDRVTLQFIDSWVHASILSSQPLFYTLNVGHRLNINTSLILGGEYVIYVTTHIIQNNETRNVQEKRFKIYLNSPLKGNKISKRTVVNNTARFQKALTSKLNPCQLSPLLYKWGDSLAKYDIIPPYLEVAHIV